MGMKAMEKEDQRLGDCSKSNYRKFPSRLGTGLPPSVPSRALHEALLIRGAIGIIGANVARGFAKRHTDADQTQFRALPLPSFDNL